MRTLNLEQMEWMEGGKVSPVPGLPDCVNHPSIPSIVGGVVWLVTAIKRCSGYWG